MIRTIKTGIAVAALAAGTVACDPRAFSDLEDETWVVTSGQPSGMDSDDYVFAMTFAGTTSGEGSRLVVMGNDPMSVGTIRYAANGGTDSGGKRITDLIAIEGSTTFDNRGPLAGPTSVLGPDGTVAIGLPEESNGMGDTGSVLLVDLATTETARQLFPIQGLSNFGTAVSFGETDFDDSGTAMGPTMDLLSVATNSVVLGIDALKRGGSGAVQPVSCAIDREVAHAILGADVDGDDKDEVLIMRGDATLDGTAAASDIAITTGTNIFDASADVAPNFCFDAGAAVPRAAIGVIAAPGGEGDFGLRLLAADFNANGTTDIVATAPSTGNVYVFLDFDVTAAPPPVITIPTPPGSTGFASSIAVGDLDGTAGDELAIGSPESAIDGTTRAGKVAVYKFSGGAFGAPINELHDIDPEADQQFGRAVAIAPFGSSGGILAVGAAGELFTYFQTDADFTDVRQ